jgi:putative FmdB family regulatory protein
LPTYEYHCDSCDRNFDVVQSFHDDPLTSCPDCGSPIRKVFGNVGIVFKGTGFYKTDSRKGESAKTLSTADSSNESKVGQEGSGSGDSNGSGTVPDKTTTSPSTDNGKPSSDKAAPPAPSQSDKKSSPAKDKPAS